jgi:hypothetical protein
MPDQNDSQEWETTEHHVQPQPGAPAEDFQQLGRPEQLAALYGALAKAQGAFAPVLKSKEVDFHSKTAGRIHFHYATLSDIDRATRPALAANGLAIFQPFTVVSHGREGVIRTVLAHADGAQVVSLIRFLPNADIKQLGGTVTYLRRYAKNAILGTDGDEDADDIPTGDFPHENEYSEDGTLIFNRSIGRVIAPARTAACDAISTNLRRSASARAVSPVRACSRATTFVRPGAASPSNCV